MALPTEPGVAPVTSKPYDLPLKHHKSIKEELKSLLEAGLIERFLSPLHSSNHHSTPKSTTRELPHQT